MSKNSTLEEIVELIKNKKFDDALKNIKSFIKFNPHNPKAFNLLGIIELQLNQYENCIKTFNKAIDLDPNYFEAQNNLGNAFMGLGKFNDAVGCYKKVLKINPDYAAGYNNIASAFNDLGNYEDAIINYSHALKLDPNLTMAKGNIIQALSFHSPTNTELNIFTKSNNTLQNIKIPESLNDELSDKSVISFYESCKQISDDNFKEFNYNLTQIWRRSNFNLGCKRHFEIFDNYKVIPEYCFGCFKVQIELSSIIDLFKLYLIFDKLNLSKNNSKKTMVELRPIASGCYKGIIYCFGIEDAEEIYSKLEKILLNKIIRKYQMIIKRGCTEFGIEHPNYKIINKQSEKFMNYNTDWKKKENIIDNTSLKIQRQKNIKHSKSINGVTLSDVLIMRNWLYYAKLIGDEDYKKLDLNIAASKYLDFELSKQTSFREKEFKKYKNSYN